MNEEEQTNAGPHFWLERTRKMIANRPRTVSLYQLAEAAGASEAWVKKVANGEIKDPSVNKIGAIFDFLNNFKSGV